MASIENTNTLQTYASGSGLDLKSIIDTKKNSNEMRKNLGVLMNPSGIPILPSSDTDLVVFGSIARDECTLKSDIDWTLLIDGQANSLHSNLSHQIVETLKNKKLIEPGSSGMFGHTTFSHELIHNIGGEDDTNFNITKRILLLLESEKIIVNEAENHGTSYDRVISGIIGQYIDHDSGFFSDRGKEYKVPRFLLNDIIRFWRTMCVDFAYKQKEQLGRKWALRNIKLRMSRKLIYVKGLLMCFSCYNNEKIDSESIKEYLKEIVGIKPLDFIVRTLLENNVDKSIVNELLISYNDFIGILNDESLRKHLNDLDMYKVYDDKQFIDARIVCDKFQESLNKVFLHDDGALKKFTNYYCVF